MASSEKASTSTRIQCHSQYCAAVNCRNSRDKEPVLSFHYFPKCGKKDKDNENALIYVAGYTCRTYLSKHSLVLVQTVPSCYKDVHNNYWKEKLLMICSFRTKHTVITVVPVVVSVCQVQS